MNIPGPEKCDCTGFSFSWRAVGLWAVAGSSQLGAGVSVFRVRQYGPKAPGWNVDKGPWLARSQSDAGLDWYPPLFVSLGGP